MSTLRKAIEVALYLETNIDKLELTKYKGEVESPRGNVNVDGFNTSIEVSKNKHLEIIFIQNHLGFSAYDEDNNILYLSAIPMYGDPKKDLIENIKDEYNFDVLIHELTHYLDWDNNEIDKLESPTQTEYFNSKAEINAFINQGIYLAMVYCDSNEPTLDDVIDYLNPGFINNLTEENKPKVKQQIIDTLEKFKNEERNQMNLS